MNHTATPNIGIQVQGKYLEEESSPNANEFVFRYHVEIHNHEPSSLQLISRYWKVEDQHGQIQEIQGLGVLGKQPHIKSGETYRYDSLVMLETPLGFMQGRFTFQDQNKATVNAPIKPFILARQDQLH